MDSSDKDDFLTDELIGGQSLPEIRRARVQSLTIYEVEESELHILERGAPDSVLLNVAIALLTLSITLTVSLLTATFGSERQWTVFLVVAVVGFLVGVTLLLLYAKSRASVSACAKTIRERLSTDWIDSPSDQRDSE